MIDPLIQQAAALLLAAIFLIAAWGKLTAPEEFEGVVGNYRLLPRAMVRVAARALPIAEFVVAALLIVPAGRLAGGAAAALLLALFAAAMAVNIRRGRREIDCGCFRSAHRQHLSWPLVGRNAVLVLFALGLLVPSTGRALGWFDWVQVCTGVAALFLVYVAASGVFLPRPPTFDDNFARSQGLRMPT